MKDRTIDLPPLKVGDAMIGPYRIGFDAESRPMCATVSADVPPIQDVGRHVEVYREAILRQVALLTDWLEATDAARRSAIVVAPKSALVRIH